MTKRKAKLLIIDDNSQILDALKILLKSEFEEIITSRNPNLIPSLLYENNIDIILLDMNFKSGDNSGNEGMFWLREIKKTDPSAVVIMITAYGDIDLAVKAIKEGATDFIAKPWEAEKLIITLHNALELKKSKAEIKQLKDRQKHLNGDIEKQFQLFRGKSESMSRIFKTIEKVAKTEANVMILGENGTGKEVIAHEIHRQSSRFEDVFLGVDLGSISESLFESEMFGHIKGAFTDAREDRQGRFESASGGTLFLDEIGNLSMNMQGKLLAALQNRQIVRVGANKPIPIDIRLITATNKNPETLVKQNLFREDLLFRINTIQIELPPLRERIEDIPGLADYFLNYYALKYDKPLLKISLNAYEKLKQYRWPGNIRELKHTIEKAVILSDSTILEPADFYFKTEGKFMNEIKQNFSLSDVEKETIQTALKQCNGNYTKAAKMLGISRTTLYSKLNN